MNRHTNPNVDKYRMHQTELQEIVTSISSKMMLIQILLWSSMDVNDLFRGDCDECDVSNVNVSMANMVPLLMYDKAVVHNHVQLQNYTTL